MKGKAKAEKRKRKICKKAAPPVLSPLPGRPAGRRSQSERPLHHRRRRPIRDEQARRSAGKKQKTLKKKKKQTTPDNGGRPETLQNYVRGQKREASRVFSSRAREKKRLEQRPQRDLGRTRATG
ncbi:hypothetical protein HPB50_022558 [Hyalomma asiaticum]|uniref:Uncharacterized protein n=1 Tax=Hyalomma asiaticum TaxID=266040 RepID=A0ACB7RYE2_HYAAI|nr:hypothetical protein HPB50_022558 [Hyalomma asiaticum]